MDAHQAHYSGIHELFLIRLARQGEGGPVRFSNLGVIEFLETMFYNQSILLRGDRSSQDDLSTPPTGIPTEQVR